MVLLIVMQAGFISGFRSRGDKYKSSGRQPHIKNREINPAGIWDLISVPMM
jgi:hypothetical protein